MSDQDTIKQDYTEEEKTILTSLEEKHKRIFAFKVKGHGLIVLRKPKRDEWRRYQTALKDGRSDAYILQENIARSLMCYPGPEALDAVLDDYPGMHSIFVMCIDNLAVGDGSEITALGKDWKQPDVAI